jgi:DNA-binding transcriptional LysR family regulator
MLASPNDLYYFNEVCHTLNFSRASERLGISQPSLSQAMKRLETLIGTSLFIRIKTGVKLTKAGYQLHSHTNSLISLWERVKAESLASCQEVQGRINFGCHSAVATDVLPLVLPDFVATYPHLEIVLLHDLSRKIFEGIVNLSIDIGIIVNPLRHPGLILQKLYDDEVCFWQAADFKWSHEEGVLIICDPHLIQTQSMLTQLRQKGITNFRTLTSGSLEVISSLIASGTGIGILPGSAAKLVKPELIKIANMPTYQDELFLVYRPEQRNLMALKVLIKAIKQAIKQLNSDVPETSF